MNKKFLQQDAEELNNSTMTHFAKDLYAEKK